MEINLFHTQSCLKSIYVVNMFVVGHVSVNGWRSSFLGLAAVNLAESAGKLISIDVLAKIYVSAAIQIRTSFPEGLHFIAVSLTSFTMVSYQGLPRTLQAVHVLVLLLSWDLSLYFSYMRRA